MDVLGFYFNQITIELIIWMCSSFFFFFLCSPPSVPWSEGRLVWWESHRRIGFGGRGFVFLFLLLFQVREVAGAQRRVSVASQSSCSRDVFDIKPFFTWAALLLVEISSHRELNVKVVLWCGKSLWRNGKKPQSAVNFKPSPRIRRPGNTGHYSSDF